MELGVVGLSYSMGVEVINIRIKVKSARVKRQVKTSSLDQILSIKAKIRKWVSLVVMSSGSWYRFQMRNRP